MVSSEYLIILTISCWHIGHSRCVDLSGSMDLSQQIGFAKLATRTGCCTKTRDYFICRNTSPDLNIFGFICHIKKAQTCAGVVPIKLRIVLYAGLAGPVSSELALSVQATS